MTEREKKIISKFSHKSWNEVKTNDSWAIFKIMSEFVEGFEKMSKIEGHPYYARWKERMSPSLRTADVSTCMN